MTEKLIDVLKKMFTTHRIVFWYDDGEKMREMYETIDLPGVTKVVLSNNEFGVKVQILRDNLEGKFLLYSPHPKPKHAENWLLDLLLANAEFSSSMPTIYLNELGWPRELLGFVESHEVFFNSAERRNKLAYMVADPAAPGARADIEQKMLAVTCGVDDSFDGILFKLFTYPTGEQDKLFEQIEKYNLADYFWATVSAKFSYREDAPNVKSLVYHIFEAAALKSIGSNFASAGANQSYIFAENWQNNKRFERDYERWAEDVTRDLGLEQSLEKAHSPTELINCDTYGFVDKIIIKDILRQIAGGTYKVEEIKRIIATRRPLHYFEKFADYYETISYGLELLERIDTLRIHIPDAKAGFEAYQKTYALIDYAYRKFVYHSNRVEDRNILASLAELIEKKYTNDYLMELSTAWQKQVDAMDHWSISGVTDQGMFYNKTVEPIARKGNRILVVISDGLRYETAMELQNRLIAEDRYTANLSAALGCMPSYTQLGMASLLPHDQITFEDNSDTVFIDGQSSQGTDNRTKILQKRNPRSVAVSYEDFINLNRETGREFIKPYDVIYVYKNKIDKVGDEKSTEHEVFKITEEELSDLVDLIKHANNLNIYNMAVTADHGYIYQHSRLDTTDFAVNESMGDKYKVNRRFIIGKNLQQADNMKKFTAKQAGFSDDTELLIPKGVGRIRVKGAGSRYVHGGAFLQEVVVPVLEINKARTTDIEYVNVVAMFPRSEISSNVIGIEFYQQEPVSGKVLPRTIVAAFYDQADNKISDEKTISAGSTDQDNSKRIIRHSFSFGADSSKLDGQRVYLKLKEQIQGTNRFRDYGQYEFDMKIAFSDEFGSF